MKRLSTSDSPQELKKRRVTYDTFEKWRTNFDRECKTVSWLDCEVEREKGKKVVTQLKCSVCAKFKASICSKRNFSMSWITGADSLRTSNIKDHAHSDQHVAAMSLLQREKAVSQGLPCSSYAPIAAALTSLPEGERQRLKYKFDTAYLVAKEKISFRKYPQLCELQTKHGIDIGKTSYTNETSAKTFIHFIAEAQRQDLFCIIQNAKFYSILLDGSTDTGNFDNELVLIVWFDRNSDGDEKVYTRTTYLKVIKPSSVTGTGLFEVLQEALEGLGVQAINAEYCTKLVGVGTDGASANIAANGLKGLVEQELNWVFWMWCLAHRLELGVKDALKDTSFADIDEMLLKLYYLYERSPKKCRQLEDIIAELKECFEFTEGGTKPVRASGSRWVGHKLNALKRVISKYGAYTSHLASLSEDTSIVPADRAKLRGYYRKWIGGKYILGCAIFVDILTPCATLSKVMQYNHLDILEALSSVLKAVKQVDQLSLVPLEKWPVYATTLEKCTTDSNGITVYQGQELKSFSSSKTYYEAHYSDYCEQITECIKNRLAWSSLQVLRDIIFVLATQGWHKAIAEHNKLEAIDRLVKQFTVPLQGAGAQVGEIHFEFDAIMQYAIEYVSLSTLSYQEVWWRLFHSPSSSEWSNALILVELLFSLPASNGKLERVFSQLGVIKTDKRSLLSNEALDDLLMITTNNIPLEKFDPNPAIDLWWNAKQRRPCEKERRKYRPREKRLPVGTPAATPITIESESSNSESEEDADHILLDDWDNFVDNDD